MLKRYRSYALGVDGQPLRNDGYYGYDEQKVQREYERRTNQPQDGIVSDHDLGALGLATPIIFTVEGHASNMWIGPTASVASTLQSQGVCYWQPIGYDVNALPFNNRSGVDELTRLVGATAMDNGIPFPAGTPWGIAGFSQGAMIVSEFMEQKVLSGPLAWRLKDFKRGLCFGNPRRETGKVAPWASNPASPGTQGIMDKLFVTTGTAIEGRWQENAKHGDMFAENTLDKTGLDKTAIAKIVCENSWAGGPASLFYRVIALMGDVPAEAIPAIKALISAIMFLASNPNPHYATVAEPGDIEFMRAVGT